MSRHVWRKDYLSLTAQAGIKPVIPKPVDPRVSLSLPLPGKTATLLVELPLTLTDIEFLHRGIEQLRVVIETEQLENESEHATADNTLSMG